jgi:hypothetical protein
MGLVRGALIAGATGPLPPKRVAFGVHNPRQSGGRVVFSVGCAGTASGRAPSV